MPALIERERTVLPPKESLDELYGLLTAAGSDSIAVSAPDGERLVLPREIIEALGEVVKAMANGQAVMIAPVHRFLTTGEAADLLGISRPTFIKLLDSNEISYERPGRHRRVRLIDVLEYRRRRSKQRRESLDRMVEIAESSGMYELTAAPIRTR